MTDVRIENHGSIALVRPLTRAANDWLAASVETDETQYWGDAIVAEPRYIPDLIQAMRAEGLEVDV